MKYNTLKFKLNKEEGIYVLTDVISYHTMFQDYPINHTPENTISHHGIEDTRQGMAQIFTMNICAWYVKTSKVWIGI